MLCMFLFKFDYYYVAERQRNSIRTPVLRWTTYGSCRGTKRIYIDMFFFFPSSGPLLK